MKIDDSNKANDKSPQHFDLPEILHVSECDAPAQQCEVAEEIDLNND